MHMSDDGMMTMAMKPYLHFTGGDPLWFEAWAPTSNGAIAGACIGLVLLAMFERLIAGIRGVLEAEWTRRSAQLIVDGTIEVCHTDLPVQAEDKRVASTPAESSVQESNGWLPSLLATQHVKNRPFIPTHDIARGVIYVAQAALGYLLMLAIMTWNASYTISIILGLGIGEALFGRFASAQGHS